MEPTDMQQKLLKVGDLAKAANKTVRAIHLYEELGLLHPVSRSTGGFRLYSEATIGRVIWIQKFQDMSFSLPEIQALLREWETAATAPTGMRLIRALFEQKLAETQESINKLRALELDLKASLRYLDTCRGCAPNHVQSECGGCGQNGHDPGSQPELVAGLAKPKPWDVPVEGLREGR